jgi:uncharacterized protein
MSSLLRHALPALLAVLAWCVPLSARAALDLYQGEAAVPAQDEDSRMAGVAKALEQVVIKVSGDRAAIANATVQSALANAGKLMQRYEYRQELVRGADGRPEVRLYLIASFYPSSVDQLLLRSGLNIWGRERPTLLVLIADGGQLLNATQAGELVERARARGLELRFPGDTQLTTDDLSALESGRIANIASRFGGGHVVGGALLPGGGRFAVDDGRGSRPFSINAEDRADTLRQLIDEAQAVLAAQLVVGGNEPEDLEVWVEGVDSATGYARVLSYLRGLTPVRAVEVSGVHPQGLKLALTVLGGAARLQQTVALGAELDMTSQDPAVLVLRQ